MLHVSCLSVACVSVWSWIALKFALQDLKTALIAMLQVYTHCLYGTVWYTISVCVLLLAHPCVRLAVGLYHPKVFEFTSPWSLDITRQFHAFMLFFLSAQRGSPLPGTPQTLHLACSRSAPMTAKRSCMVVQPADLVRSR